MNTIHKAITCPRGENCVCEDCCSMDERCNCDIFQNLPDALNDNEAKKKIYIVVETIYDRQEASKYNGGEPYVCKTEDEAIKEIKQIVEGWPISKPLKLGENDGEKWAVRRYDEDGTYAVVEDCDCFRKVEIFEREV